MHLSEAAMQAFHTPEYISFLKHVTPENQERHAKQLTSYV